MRVASDDVLRSVQMDNRPLSNPAVVNKKEVFKHLLRSSAALFWIWPPLVVILIWLVVTRSVTAYLADVRPDVALKLQATNPEALLSLAETELNRAQIKPESSTAVKIDPQVQAQIRSWAGLALRNDPLNARALLILGQLAQNNSDDKRTDTLMRAATRRSLRESRALYWVLMQSYERQDYHAALRYADALLRTRGQIDLYRSVVPILAKIAENTEASDELKQRLGENPPWRNTFFSLLTLSISDARTPLELLLALKDTANPPRAEEIKNYLDFLIDRGFHELAYYAWLQFLPPEQLSRTGRLVNGDFETSPSGMPFDWQFASKAGATIEVTNRPAEDGGGQALFINFGTGGGRVDFSGVSQLVFLAPGSYEFRGKQKVDIISKMGLRWQITCAGKTPNQIGESGIVNGRDKKWTEFAFPLAVPETDCTAQQIRLGSQARSASEQFISGSMWVDNLEIVRASTSNP